METTKRDKKKLVLACFFNILATLSMTACAYLFSVIVDFASGQSGAENKSIKNIVLALLAMMGLLILDYIFCAYHFKIKRAYVSGKLNHVRNGITKNMLLRPFSVFRENTESYYLSLLMNDVGIYGTMLESIPNIICTAASIVVNFAMLFYIHPILAIIAAALALLPLYGGQIFSKRLQKIQEEYSEKNQAFTEVTKETVEGYETIRMDNRIQPFLQRFAGIMKNRQKVYDNYTITSGKSNRILIESTWVLQISCIGISALLIWNGKIGAGMLLPAVTYFGGVSNDFSNLIEYVVSYRAAKPIKEKISKEYYCPCEETEIKSITEYSGSAVQQADLKYQNISFAFGEKQLYNHFNYEFEPGGCYAIVGESGSGKSTLMKLLLKQHEDYTGKITLAGKDIRDMSEREIYSFVGVISQSAHLFNASLYENITLYSGKPEKDSAEYKELLQKVNLTKLAETVGDAPLGDFGDKISGGERQRICIARMMRHHLPVLIFDEPTTGLDPENVKLINDFIFAQEGITRVVISHDWSEEYWKRFDGIVKIGEEKRSA